MKIFRYRILLMFSFIVLQCPGFVAAQYAPPVGQPGTTAIYKDSTAFVGWATGCSVIRGWQDISNTSLGLVSVGDSSMATGPAGTNGVVSLGDGGSATLTFEWPLVNGAGWDFAVFENSFDDFFLELAFVAVSSDGEHFYRFPPHSLTDTTTQTGGFDSTDATRINNLAGKYRGMYGTPFDLEELSGAAGLDVNRVTHIRITDVVGSLNPSYATYDTAGNKINDPWPTPFTAGGFDLDAVGVIWNQANGLAEQKNSATLSLWPNPAADQVSVRSNWPLTGSVITVYDLSGNVVLSQTITHTEYSYTINTSQLPGGFYILNLENETRQIHAKFIKQ